MSNYFVNLSNKTERKMDIQTRKIEFVQKFLELQNEELIFKFEKLMKKTNKAETEKKLKPFTVEELNKRAAQSEEDFKNGRYKSTEELLGKY